MMFLIFMSINTSYELRTIFGYSNLICILKKILARLNQYLFLNNDFSIDFFLLPSKLEVVQQPEKYRECRNIIIFSYDPCLKQLDVQNESVSLSEHGLWKKYFDHLNLVELEVPVKEYPTMMILLYFCSSFYSITPTDLW